MISFKEERPKKQNIDYNLFYSNELSKMQKDIDNLKKTNKKVNKNLKYTLNDMQKIIQEYKNFCKNKNIQKKPSNENILKKKEEYLDSIINNNNKSFEYINKINKIYNEIQDKMKSISNPEFAPPNINSFSSNIQEYSFESNNDNNISQNSEISNNDEENDVFKNIYGNNSSMNNSNNISNNKKKSIFEPLIKKTNNNNINNNIQKKDEDIYFFSDDESYLENEKEYNNFCNNFYFVIHLIEKKNLYLTNEIESFSKQIIQKLNIKENNTLFSFGNRNSFTETFIKEKNFASLSIKEIQKYYPDFNKLYEYKMIYDNILDNKAYLDYNGNTINPNSSYNIKRGTELYDPPYGWLGIGLNVNEYKDKDWLYNKSNTSKWAIAYYGIGQFLSYNQVKETLNNIILKKNLKISQRFKDYSDKRHYNNTVGEGICLSPKINLAENYSGIILINGKRYKVVLMAKVLIEKIREIYDIEFWILNKDDIRFYRILLKEVN